MSVRDALANVRRQPVLRPDRVAVLVCPPTTRWRILVDRVLPNRVLRRLRWHSDFVRTMATERFVTVGDYWRSIGAPVAAALAAVADTGCYVMRDVTFREFTGIFSSSRFDAVFLVTHHIVALAQAEFSDGPRSLNEVNDVANRSSAALLLFSCSSATWRDEIVSRGQHHVPAAGAPWRLPFAMTMLFLLYWLREINGRRTLDEALSTAIQAFEHRRNDEVSYD